MGKIHVLASAVADQIAAGEVVERPASVVKELLENAVDAGAVHVVVDVAGGGLARLIVQDDGSGMDDDDAVLCFARHATSKLRVADDLKEIGTFGFRGEALAAISSVARVRLVTKPKASPRAFAVDVDAGRVVTVGEAAGTVGTRVEVHDLFYNVPARKKFLKTERTEVAHIEDTLLDVALTNPALGLRLLVDQKIVLDLPPVPVAASADVDDAAQLATPARIDRVVRCLGKHVRPLLYPVYGKTELLTLRGHVVAPLETRRDLGGIHLSVNGRPVADKNLVQAVRAAFRTLLEVGRQPIVSLDLAIAPAEVDVNVHPRKAEVRFVDPRRVSGHLISLLSDFLATTPWLSHKAPAHTFSLAAPSASSTWTAMSSTPPPSMSSTNAVVDAHADRVRAALARFSARSTPPTSLSTPPTSAATSAASSSMATSSASPTLPTLASAPGRGGAASFAALRVVGQVGGTYLLLEGPQGLVVIDQHAAHERVVFERLRAARRAGTTPSQPLLLPITLELGAKERAAVDDEGVKAELMAHGIDVDGYHGHTALVRALPPGLDGKKAAAIVRDALYELGVGDSGRTATLDERTDAVCARLACHAAVRAGDVLAPVQVRALLEDLDKIDLGAHCPHGRPVVRTVAYGELAGWFDR
jgi:DNA mismatch repair protein MutL